jgi:hypothetical protein
MTQFDEYYYHHCCGMPYERNDAWLSFFGAIANRIVQDIQPGTVLDAGCAMGFLVESLRRLNIEAYGVDISAYALQKVHQDIRPYCWEGSITDPFPDRYDLIVSIEVLEHMPKEQAETAIRNMCRSSDDILFSSTPFDYKEATHFNVQPPEYWAEQFARCGFIRDVDFDASFITPWAVRFRRSSEPLHRVVRNYERRFSLLSKETNDLRSLVAEMQARISDQDSSIQSLSSRLEDIYRTRSWLLISRMQQARLKLIPLGSRREKLLHRLVRR